MGIVAFKWENKQLTLLHNRDNLESWAIKAAAWDEEHQILSGRSEQNSGTWFGISRQGRVAFLVDALVFKDLTRSVLLPLDFLQGEMSPAEYAMALDEDIDPHFGMAYNLIVADINSNSMVYISKQFPMECDIRMEEVGFGVHTLSLAGGLDGRFSKDLRLKELFNEMISEYENRELPPMKEMAERFMYDPHEAYEGDKLSAIFVDMITREGRYRTTSTTALAVKPTKEVMFYERYLENGEWTDNDLITFNID